MSEDVVLDGSAVLCLLKEETGTPRVEAALPRASISAVNLAEVVTKLAEAGGSAAHIAAILDALDLPIVEFDERQAVTCGLLRVATKARGLWLGDRACLALAFQRSATALAADHAWEVLPSSLGIRVEMIQSQCDRFAGPGNRSSPRRRGSSARCPAGGRPRLRPRRTMARGDGLVGLRPSSGAGSPPARG